MAAANNASIAIDGTWITSDSTQTSFSKSISTNFDCELIVLTINTGGNSARKQINNPTVGSTSMTQVGSAVATSEGIVEMYYLNSGTKNLNTSVTFENGRGAQVQGYISAYSSDEALIYGGTDSAFSTSGTTSTTSITIPANNGSVIVDAYHSGYPSITNCTESGTRIYLNGRTIGAIGGTSYQINTSTFFGLGHTTPSSDDYATVAGAFYAAYTAPTGDITSLNGKLYSGVSKINDISTAFINKINTKDT